MIVITETPAGIFIGELKKGLFKDTLLNPYKIYLEEEGASYNWLGYGLSARVYKMDLKEPLYIVEATEEATKDYFESLKKDQAK